jgi:hypothetical protein
MKKQIKYGRKLNFSFDVSALPAYTKQERLPLVTRSVFDADIAALPGLNTMLNVKYKDTINKISDEIIFQDGGVCGNDPSGNTVFSKKEVAVGRIEVFKDWCPKDLETKWAQVLLPNGSHYEDLPQRDAITEFLMSLMVETNAVGLWQSSTAHSQANLKRYDGLIKQIDADSPIAANVNGGGYTAQSSITDANIKSILDQMVKKLPARLKKKADLAFFMGWGEFEAMLRAYQTLNNYFIDMSDAGPYTTGQFKLPLWGITVYAMHGLTDTNRIFLARESNMWIITDMSGEDENWDIWYERKDNKIYGRVEFKLGTQVTFGNEIVQYTNA